jgi:hypothetical protein
MRLHAMGIASIVAMFAASCGEEFAVTATDAGRDTGSDAVDPAPPSDAGSDAAPECTEVPCNATVVANELPRGIAASAELVAWIRGRDLRVIHADGGELKTLYTWQDDLNGDVVVGNAFVFFSEGNGLRGCPHQGCANPSAPMYGLATLGPIAVDGDVKFVAEVAGTHRIARCTTAVSCGQTPEFAAALPASARHLQLTAARVVAGLTNGAIYTFLRSSVLDAGAADGGTATSLKLVASASVLGGLAVDTSFAYWTDVVDGTLRRCALSGCTEPEVLAKDLKTPQRIVVDGPTLYFTEQEADAVKACPKDACTSPRTIARVAKPTLLAVGDRVYVVSEGDKKVYATNRAP